MTRRCVIYARISVQKDESVSIDRQIEAGKQYAAMHGMEVVGVYRDEGVSATHNKPEARAGWSALLDSTEPFEAVIVWKIDRLARRIVDFWDAVTALSERGRSLVSIADSLDMSTTVGQIVAGVLAGFAQMEAEGIRDRVKAARRHLLHNGRLPGGTIPYGWKAVPNPDGPGYILRQDPEKIDYVRGAVEKVQRGVSLYTVKQWLDDVGAPLPTASQARRTREGWSYSTLDRLMRNPVLAGMIPFNPGNRSKTRGHDVVRDDKGLPVVDEAVAIMTVAEWRAMGEALKNRDTPQSRPRALKGTTSALLSGLVRCGHCDARMHRKTTQGRAGYYCPQCRQTITKLEDYVVEEFLSRMGNSLRMSMVEEVYDGGAELLPEIEHRLRELGEQLQATDDDAEAGDLTQQMANLRQMRREARQAQPSRRFVPVRGERTFGEDWAEAETVEDRRAVLDDALEQITVRRGRGGGRGVDRSRLTFEWRIPADMESPDDELLATWADN